MSSDYDSITAENTRRLGTDTRSRRTQVSMYSDPTHFVYEVLQNADDYGATEIDFTLEASKLVITHNGTPFTEENVRAITLFGQSTSQDDFLKTGRFGVGFKSVFAYTATPRIASGDEQFEIYGLYRIRPWTPPREMDRFVTRIELPFNHNEERPDFVEDDDWVTAAQAFDRIGSRLRESLEPATLLFTQNLKSITWKTGRQRGSHERTDRASRGVRETTISSGTRKTTYLVFSRPIHYGGSDRKPVEVAFALDEAGHPDRLDAPLCVLFPTAVPTGLGFIINGPFLTNPARETVGYDKQFNRFLVKQAGTLIADSLIQVRAQGLLDAAFVEVLPNSDDALHDFYDPIRSEVLLAFRRDDLVPTDQKREYAPSSAVFMGPAPLRDVIRPDDLSFFIGREGVSWAVGVRPNSRCLRFFKDLGIAEWGWEELSDDLTSRFDPDPWNHDAIDWLGRRTNEWLKKLYLRLAGAVEEGNCDSYVGNAPIMRAVTNREVGHHPFTSVYFPRRGFTDLPQVKKAWITQGRSAPDLQVALETLGIVTK